MPHAGLVRAAGLEPAQRLLAEGFSYQLRLSPPRHRAFARGSFVVWTIPSPWARDRAFRCCPSSLYTFASRHSAGTRLARDCQLKGFPEFEQFCTLGFPRGTQVVLSPLRLPIPPCPRTDSIYNRS